MHALNMHDPAHSRSELTEELEAAMQRKKEVKELLRKFESQFESVHGRYVCDMCTSKQPTCWLLNEQN